MKPLHQRNWRPTPWPLRSIALLLVFLELFTPLSPEVWGAVASFETHLANTRDGASEGGISVAPQEVVVNRVMPKVTPPSTTLTFSANPDAAEISRARIFAEPLVPTSTTVPDENLELAGALKAFVQRTKNDDFTALVQFLEGHSHSAWRASLLAEMGVAYRHSGWFSKALTCWNEAWTLAKDKSTPAIKSVADLAVSELLELNARLGRYDELSKLLAQIEGREMNPALSEKLRGVRGRPMAHAKPA